MTLAVTANALDCRSLAAGYGGGPVIRDISIGVAPGTVLGLFGPNGAGKTTTLLALAGLLPRLQGAVNVKGIALESGRPRDASRLGVVLVPDDRALFSGMSVAENLEVARLKGGPQGRSMIELFPGLEKRWDVAAASLSGGEQQMLAVARALMREPTVLLIDELSMGLAPVVVEAVLPAIRRVADERGTAVVLVEQHIRLALGIADAAIVMVHGEVVLQGTAASLIGDFAAFETAYLGTNNCAPGPPGG